MKLTVSQRIGGGYAIVLALALGILFTGLIAITRINTGLTDVADRAAPMLNQGGQLKAAILLAHAAVNRHLQQGKATDLPGIETDFASQRSATEQALAELQRLSADDASLTAALSELNVAVTPVFAKSDEIFAAHRRELEFAASVSKQTRQFGDMADEVESAALDAGTDARAIARNLANVRTMAERTLEKTNAMAVLASERDLQNQFAEIDQQLSQLADRQSSSLQAPYARFKQAIIGDGGLIKSLGGQLNQRKTAASKATELETEVQQLIAQIQAVLQQVDELTATIKTAAGDSVASSRFWLITFAVVALLAAAGTGYWVVNSIRGPLIQVVGGLKQVATGNLRVRIDLHREDELGEVADSLRELIDRMREILTAIQSNSEQLASAAEQTSVISNHSLEAISRQQQQTELVASAITEMAATVEDVAKSAARTLTQVENTSAETHQGQAIVDDNIRSIRHLAAEIDRAAQVIARVSTDSDNIGAVLDVIRGVAEQTNLLALNAAIEAARAGEQGRGFAVVADEVRTLASRSQTSTTEIQEIIARLQAGTRDAVQVMSSSCRDAQSSVDNIARAGTALTKISESVLTIKDMSTQIASAAEEQNSVTQELHRNTVVIAEVAEQNAVGARENRTASQALAHLAEQQQELVKRFVLN
jgi:methyl-accepting chemotaxis protein